MEYKQDKEMKKYMVKIMGNNEKINDLLNTVICICGSHCYRQHYRTHLKSYKHIDFLNGCF